MQNILKALLLAVAMGAVSFLLLLPAVGGRAAPSALPSCGHNPVFNSPGLFSGSPDMAISNDILQTNTAIVWFESDTQNSPQGKIRLVYSTVDTATTAWNPLPPTTVDSGTDNSEPSIVFDPVLNNTVHIAYRKGTGGIYYSRCVLGGSCLATPVEIATGGVGWELLNPEIAVMTGTTVMTVVIVYQGTNGSDQELLRYAYIPDSGGGTGTGTPVVDKILRSGTHTNNKERNPTVVHYNGKVHVAYVRTNAGADEIEYLNLSSSQLAGGAVGPSKTFINGLAVTNPEFPAIAVNKGGFIALVWEVQLGSPPFSLVYNTSTNEGGSWDEDSLFADFRFLLSNSNTASTGRTQWDSNNSNVDLLRFGLQADVAVDESDNLHVVWQARTVAVPARYDIVYARYSTGKWYNGSPVSYTTSVSYTNVTTIYTQIESGNLDKLQPKVVFGEPGQRLQLVYMAETNGNTSWNVVYNGWQFGPAEGFTDSDCDGISDADEGAGDSDGDGIPDFLDDFDNSGGVFLPIILKNSS